MGLDVSKRLALMANRRNATLIAAAIYLAACDGRAEIGRVVDSESGKGMAGVHIVKIWHAAVPSIVIASAASCMHHEVALSGPDGTYVLPQWGFPIYALDRRTELVIFKEGYLLDEERTTRNIIQLRRDTGSADERFRLAYRTTEIGCPDRGPALIPVMQARIKEAQQLASTPLQQGIVQGLQQELSMLTGSERERK